MGTWNDLLSFILTNKVKTELFCPAPLPCCRPLPSSSSFFFWALVRVHHHQLPEAARELYRCLATPPTFYRSHTKNFRSPSLAVFQGKILCTAFLPHPPNHVIMLRLAGKKIFFFVFWFFFLASFFEVIFWFFSFFFFFKEQQNLNRGEEFVYGSFRGCRKSIFFSFMYFISFEVENGKKREKTKAGKSSGEGKL